MLPNLRDAYQSYLDSSDLIADGPTHRFLTLALAEKSEQISAFSRGSNQLYRRTLNHARKRLHGQKKSRPCFLQ